MKGKRHAPEQIIAKLREADAMLGTGRHWDRSARSSRSASPRFTAGAISTGA